MAAGGYVKCRVPPEPTFSTPVDFNAAYDNGSLADFFELPSGAVDAALAVQRPVDHQRLADALKRNALRLGAPSAVLRNIEKLRHPNARAVITGQQVGLLLGPTYGLSKAVTAIRLAQRLDSDERPVVPLFWLATQDHDSEEVDHTYLLDGSENLRRVAVQLPEGVAAGRVRVSDAMVRQALAGLASLTPTPQFLPEVRALVQEGAAVGGFGDWFAVLLLRLLGDAGLVPVDPLQPDFAALTVPLLRAELQRPERSVDAINNAGARLKALGFEPQLGRGAHATNLFIELGGAAQGPQRTLLRYQDGVFHAAGQRFSRAELDARLEDDPTCITPAAGLRPVTQDAALPTALFVLGPGELKYVAQLRGVYQGHGVPMPLAWRRASVTVLEPVAQRLLQRYGMTAAQFRQHHASEFQRLLLERAGLLQRFQHTSDLLEASLVELLAEVAELDPTLDGTVRRGHRHLEMTLTRLRGKSAAALAQRDLVARSQFDRLKAHLLPLDQPAERILSPLSHALKFGLQPLIDRFLALEPSGEQELAI